VGLSEAGLTVPTGADFLDSMIDDYEQLTGLTVDRTRTDDQFVMVMAVILAAQLGGLGELLQAVYDGTSAETAIGKQLEDASFLVGVEPDPATKSQSKVTLTGTVGTIVAANAIVAGGGPDDDARWLTSEDKTIAGTGSPADDVVVVAQEAGPITASIGQIDQIVTGIPGWTGVTNAASADPGTNRESDSSIRLRRRAALQRLGSASTSAIRATILDRDYIDEVIVLENNSSSIQTISGKVLNPNAVHIFIVPDSLTTEQEDEIAEGIHLKTGAATELMGSGGATEVIRQVSDVGGVTTHTVKWDYGTKTPTTILAAVTLLAGFELADVDDAVTAAITEFMATFKMGDTLRVYDLIIATEGIEGIASISFTSTPLSPLDFTPAIDELITLTSVTVS